MDRTGARSESAAERVFIRTVSAIGIGVFSYALVFVVLTPVDTQWLLLGLVTVLVVSRLDLHIPKTSGTITVSDTLTFTSLFLFGLLPSVVLAGVDAAVCSLHYKNRRKVVPFNAAVMSLSIYLAGLVVTELFGDLRKVSPDVLKLLMAAGCLALVHYAINSGIVGLVNALRQTHDRMKTWREYVLYTSLSYFAGAAAACLIVKLIAVISFYAFIIAVPILASIYLTYKAYLDKVDSSVKHAEQLADLHLRTIEALAIAIDAKDEVTHDHVRRVQIYATGLARLFGLTEREIEALRAGALLHDIGKLAVPDYILNKPGPLTLAEFEKMKVHTIVGAEILERVGFPYPVVPVVRHHHERWDGRGYPDGLRGDEIPMTARILTVSDCFDAVREDRQYRKAMTRGEAISMLKEGSGNVFDPAIIGAFLDHLDDFESQIREEGVERSAAGVLPRTGLPRSANQGSEPMVYERIRSAHREVIALYDIAQTIGTSLDLRDTFAV